MVFTNEREEGYTFIAMGVGDYFREGRGFYVKTDVKDEYGDYYAINLETGESTTFSPNTPITAIEIKEIIYEDV